MGRRVNFFVSYITRVKVTYLERSEIVDPFRTSNHVDVIFRSDLIRKKIHKNIEI
jgi:hypothetical protein